MKKLLIPIFLLCGYCSSSQVILDLGLGINTDAATVGFAADLDIGKKIGPVSIESNLMFGSYNQMVGASIGYSTPEELEYFRFPFRFYAGPVLSFSSANKDNEGYKWFVGIKHAGVDIRYIHKQEIRVKVVFNLIKTYQFLFL